MTIKDYERIERYINREHKKRRFTKFLIRAGAIIVVILLLSIVIDFIRFPECYLSTMKYQLQNDIKRGNEQAIEYYENTYIKNGRILFE